MSYSTLDEAYETPERSHILNRENKLKEQLNITKKYSTPERESPDMYSAQGDYESLHEGTPINKLNIETFEDSFEETPIESLDISQSRPAPIEHSSENRMNQQPINTNNPKYLSQQIQKVPQKNIPNSKITKKKQDPSYINMFNQFIARDDIKEVLFVIIFGIVLLFLIDLIILISRNV